MSILVVVGAVLISGCGGGDNATSDTPEPGDPGGGSQTTTAAQPGGGSGDEILPEASGALPDNAIRIGDQVWMRTLPMTTGQCFLYMDDGSLPTSASAWGTLDNDEDYRFSARYGQDGTFESEVSNNANVYWASGPRFGEDDLTIELDFDNLVISGSGVYRSLTTNQRAQGSFSFTCEPEDQ